jgi:SSS family solute:Na+ symporter
MISSITIWGAIALFAILGAVLSWLATRENTATAADYFVGGRNIGGVIAGLSYAATTYSAFMLVVLTGLTYRGGVGALGFELVFLLPYCTTQMAGVGLLLSGVTGGEISLFQAVVTGAVLAVFWTLFAGLRSVAWTDAVQAVVMVVSGALAVGFAISAIGGVGLFMDATLETNGAWLDVPGPGLWKFTTFAALALPWFFFAISNPQVSQRLFILRDFKSMRRMIMWVLGFGFVFTVIAVIWGFAALQLSPGLENTATATPALLTSGAIPTWVSLLLILGILAAAVSTLDSIALTMGSMVARDLLPVASDKDARDIMIGRGVVILVIVFASYFALQSARTVDQLAALSAAGLLVTVPPIVGAFFWTRSTAMGALACMLVGAGTAVYMSMFNGVSVFNPVLALTVGGVSIALFIVVSLLTKPSAQALDFKAELAEELAKHGAW